MLSVEDTTSQVSNITLKWYRQLGNNFIDKIVSYAKNPFVEIRSAGFGVLFALASQQWGQEVIQQVPGNFNYFVIYKSYVSFMLFRISRVFIGSTC